jgi:hypothetical protein
MNELMGGGVEAGAKGWKVVYTVVERGEKRFWLRVGTAFVNRDQSINVKLDAAPTNGTLQIREPDDRPRERRAGGREADAAAPFFDEPGARRGGVA